MKDMEHNARTGPRDATLPHGAWVLVADGEKALFLKNVTDGADPFLAVVRQEGQDNPADRAQGTDRPGRSHDGPGAYRSALAETDWHQIAKDRFADDLAKRLYALAHRGEFDRIVLVAPPATLGELRRVLHEEVQARVVAELPKTLTNHPLDEIERRIRADLAAA